ncbi:Chaperone protein HtpG [Dirofilaria immitis]
MLDAADIIHVYVIVCRLLQLAGLLSQRTHSGQTIDGEVFKNIRCGGINLWGQQGRGEETISLMEKKEMSDGTSIDL